MTASSTTMIAAQNSRFPFKATLPLRTHPRNSGNASAGHSTAGTNGRSQLDWTGGSSGPDFQRDAVHAVPGLAVPAGAPTADSRNSGRAPEPSHQQDPSRREPSPGPSPGQSSGEASISGARLQVRVAGPGSQEREGASGDGTVGLQILACSSNEAPGTQGAGFHPLVSV